MTLTELCHAIGWPHWDKEWAIRPPFDRPRGVTRQALTSESTDDMLLLLEHRWSDKAWNLHTSETQYRLVVARGKHVGTFGFRGYGPTPAAAIFAALVASVEET